MAVGLLALAACSALQTSQPAATTSHPGAATSRTTELSPYLDTLERMAPGDTNRQAAELAAVLGASQQAPTATNRLRYAIALGAAGHPRSNPIEAKRLITEILASQNDLKPQEVEFANAYLREFDARVALYADIARQREDLERRLQATNADDDKRYASLAAENTKLKKALAEAERKLEAVAEMERTLIEQSGAAQPNDKPPPR
ncbi:MAG TPA: hypothetical protein VLB69_08190 [Rudaea sp.]|nr:hypothetical protein [Rudaea sp.]